MPLKRTILATLTALALTAPAAWAGPTYAEYPVAQPTVDEQTQDFRSADAIDSAVQAEKRDQRTFRSAAPAAKAELQARGRDGVQTGSLAGTTDETTAALAQEQYYVSQAEDLAALVREQESASGSGNQGAPRPDEDDSPWAIVGIGIGVAALGGGGLIVARRTRARVAA